MNARTLSSLLSASFVVGLAGPSGAQGQLLQSPACGYSTGHHVLEDAHRPQHAASADMNGDGYPDLVIAHAGNIVSPKVSVMFNDGDGSYGSPVNYFAPGQTMEAACADFDGDGDVDAAFAQSNDGSAGNRVLVYENTGDGTLLPYVSYTVGTGPTGLIAVDVDLDGDTDLVSANNFWLQEDVSVLYNDGSGSFPTRVDFAIPGANPIKVAAGDLDGDGDPDLVVSLQEGDPAFAVLTNDGFGSFGPPALTSVDHATYYKTDVAVADIDLDGDQDVLYGTSGWYNTWNSYGFALYRNRGDGSLGAMESISVGDDFSVIYDFAVADVTGDGWPDVLGTARTSRKGMVLVAGDGAGGFVPAVVYQSGEYSRSVTVDDVDMDGDPDAIVVNHASLTVKVFENDGSGFPKPTLLPLGPYIDQMAAGDLDQDGDVDLVTGDSAGFFVLDNQGAGTFVQEHQAVLGAKAYTKLRDLNGDGFPDALYAGAGLARALNDGTGNFGEPVSVPVPGAAGGPDTLDMDNDGDLDAVLTGSVLSENGFFTLENDGSGNFGPATFTGSASVGSILQLATGDFTGDGNGDVVTGVWGGIWLWPGDGTGGFGAPIHRDFGEGGVANMTSGDFDGDGKLDVAGSDWGSTDAGETLTVVFGTGDGSFTEPVTYYGMFSQWLGGIAGLSAGDADGDGDLDLFGGCRGAEDVAIFLNNGDRTFAPEQRYGVDGDVQWITTGDFDGDGRADVVASIVDPATWTPPEGGGLTVLLSAPAGPFTNLGFAMSGSMGMPTLVGVGYPAALSPVGVEFAGVDPGTHCFLVFSQTRVDLPLFDGTLVPSPDTLISLFAAGDGGFSLNTTWPSGLPAGTSFFAQVWAIDPLAPTGVCASNALQAVQQQ